MKKRNRIILLLTVLIIIFSTGAIITTHVKPSKSSEIKDLSNITLPSYSLPKGSLTKEQAIKVALNISKGLLKHGQIPQNPQCVLMPYGEAEKLLLDVNIGNLHPELVTNLIYVVTIDVDRTAPGEVMRWRPRAKSVTFHQDSYFISPVNGDVIGHGYEGTKWILPKQK